MKRSQMPAYYEIATLSIIRGVICLDNYEEYLFPGNEVYLVTNAGAIIIRTKVKVMKVLPFYDAGDEVVDVTGLFQLDDVAQQLRFRLLEFNGHSPFIGDENEHEISRMFIDQKSAHEYSDLVFFSREVQQEITRYAR